jgi:hypothetical protein
MPGSNNVDASAVPAAADFYSLRRFPALRLGGIGFILLGAVPLLGDFGPLHWLTSALLCGLGAALIHAVRQGPPRLPTSVQQVWIAGPDRWTGSFRLLGHHAASGRDVTLVEAELPDVVRLATELSTASRSTAVPVRLRARDIPSPPVHTGNADAHETEAARTPAPISLQLAPESRHISSAAVLVGIAFVFDVVVLSLPLTRKLPLIVPLSYVLAVLPLTVPFLVAAFLRARKVTLTREGDGVSVSWRVWGYQYRRREHARIGYFDVLKSEPSIGEKLILVAESGTLTLTVCGEDARQLRAWRWASES